MKLFSIFFKYEEWILSYLHPATYITIPKIHRHTHTHILLILSQGRTAAAQCSLFTYKSVPVIFEPPCTIGPF